MSIDSKITGHVPYVEFTYTTGGAAHEEDVLIELKKADSTAEDERYVMDVYVSDDADGDGIATTGSDTEATVETGGYLLDTILAGKHWLVQTSATGKCTIVITSSGDEALYVCVRDPRTGRLNVSDALASYGE